MHAQPGCDRDGLVGPDAPALMKKSSKLKVVKAMKRNPEAATDFVREHHGARSDIRIGQDGGQGHGCVGDLLF